MASVYSNNGWLFISFYKDGTRHRRSLKLKDTSRNRTKAAEIVKAKSWELRNDSLRANGLLTQITFTDAAELFHAIKTKQVKASSAKLYQFAFQSFAEFLKSDPNVKDIRTDIFFDYRNYLIGPRAPASSGVERESRGNSHNTAATYINHLKIFFEWLKEEKYIDRNPVPRINPVKTQFSVIPEEHYKLIINSLNPDQQRLIKFLWLTGFRRNEALDLTWKDIDWHEGIIRVMNQKEGREDIFPLYPELKTFLKSIKRSSSARPLNRSSSARPERSRGGVERKLFDYKPSGLKFFPRACQRLGLPHYSIHDIRRTFGTRYAQKGMSEIKLKSIMRHNDIRTTNKYYVRIDIKKIAQEM